MATPDVRVRLSTEGLEEVVGAFRRMSTEAKRSARDTEGAFGGVVSRLRDFRGILAGIAGGAAVTGLTRLASSALSYGDAIDEATSQTGLSARAMSELAYAAKTVDVDLNALTRAFREMGTLISQAAQGNKAATASLTALGLSARDLRALSPEQQFEAIADQISRLPTPADRARAAVEIFGRAGGALIPILEGGTTKIRELREEAVRMGRSLSDEQAKQLAAGREAVDRLRASFDGLVTTLVAKAAPALTTFFDRLRVAVNGTELERLEQQIRDLEKLIAEGNPTAGGGGRFAGLEGAQVGLAEQRRQLAALRARQRALIDPPGGRSRRSQAETRSIAPAAPPGFQGADQGGGARTGRDPLEIVVNARRIETSAIDEFYQRLNDSTRTSTEIALDGYRQQKAALDVLLESRQISEDQYRERLLAATDAVLAPIEVTTQRVKAATVEINEFQVQAARGTQEIIASSLANGFEGGARGILRSFVDLIRQLTAQALAAQLATKLFGNVGAGGARGGGGLLGGFLGGLFGFADGGFVSGPGTGTSDSIPARLSAGEYVVRASAVAQPGALQLLEALNSGTGRALRSVRPRGYANGGLVEALPPAGAQGSGVRIVNVLDPGMVSDAISSPTGERTILNVLERNRSAFKRLLG